MSASPTSLPLRAVSNLVLSPRKSALAILLGAICAVGNALAAPPELVGPGSVLAFGLAWAALVDSDRFILPDLLTLGLLITGLLVAHRDGVASALPYVLGALAGYLCFAIVAWLYRRIRRRHGLGLGDAKLLAAAGAWLGWAALPFVVLTASAVCLAGLAGIAIAKRRRIISTPVPFGPFLAAAIWIVWMVQLDGRA